MTVSVSKLKYQRRYDLLHGKEISARAVDADGRELPVSVIKLIAPDGSQLEKELNPEAFWTCLLYTSFAGGSALNLLCQEFDCKFKCFRFYRISQIDDIGLSLIHI